MRLSLLALATSAALLSSGDGLVIDAKDPLVARTNMATSEDARELLTVSESESDDTDLDTKAPATKGKKTMLAWDDSEWADQEQQQQEQHRQQQQQEEEEEVQSTSTSDDASGSFDNPFDFFMTLYNLTQSASGSGPSLTLTSEEIESMRDIIGSAWADPSSASDSESASEASSLTETKDIQKMKKTGGLRTGHDEDDSE